VHSVDAINYWMDPSTGISTKPTSLFRYYEVCFWNQTGWLLTHHKQTWNNILQPVSTSHKR